jgi:hypothetical protein
MVHLRECIGNNVIVITWLSGLLDVAHNLKVRKVIVDRELLSE